MKEEMIYQSSGVEVVRRETFHPDDLDEGDYTTVELDLKVGGWLYDRRPDIDHGLSAMSMSIDYLIADLVRVREIIIRRKEDQKHRVG